MNNKTVTRTARNSMFGVTIGVFLFITGALLTMLGWSAILGIPLMIAGVVVPFQMGNMGAKGESWTGTTPRRHDPHKRHKLDSTHSV